MTVNDPRISYLLRQGDTPLILAQRLCAWCGHAPELEIDLALANIGLDLLGRARHFLGYAAELAGPPCNEDSLAFGRDERQFHNLLLAEQPNGGFNDTLVRQFLLDAYHVQLHQALSRSRDAQIAAIAAKSLKEADYHLRFSHGWMIRPATATTSATARSSNRWITCGASPPSCSTPTRWSWNWRNKASPSIRANCRPHWQAQVAETLRQATLALPAEQAFRHGGKQGRHSEHLGPLLAEMQFLQRAYPNGQW